MQSQIELNFECETWQRLCVLCSWEEAIGVLYGKQWPSFLCTMWCSVCQLYSLLHLLHLWTVRLWDDLMKCLFSPDLLSLSQILSGDDKWLCIRKTSAKCCKCHCSSNSEIHWTTYSSSARIDWSCWKKRKLLFSGLLSCAAPVWLWFENAHSMLPSYLKPNLKNCRNKHCQNNAWRTVALLQVMAQ